MDKNTPIETYLDSLYNDFKKYASIMSEFVARKLLYIICIVKNIQISDKLEFIGDVVVVMILSRLP